MTRVALVTGATDGIGRATAGRLARDGWEVVAVGRSPAKVEAVAAEVGTAGLVADLTSMAEIRALADAFLARYDHLDLLLLNANHITQERELTAEGIEKNYAIGYYGRALLAWRLEGAMAPSSQVLQVVGLNLDRIDFADPKNERGPSAMASLGRWQWAAQVWAREWTRRSAVPHNVYMPGLVRTKILANEPQPMRLIVRVAGALVGVPVDRAGDELASVVEQIAREGLRDEYFARTKRKPRRNLGDEPGDGERLWALTEEILAPWRGGAAR